MHTRAGHARLIYANEQRPYEVSHHCSPKNGMVHSGHPRLCDDAICCQWGVELLEEQDRETVRRINENLDDDHDGSMAVPVITLALIAAVSIAAAIFAVTR